MGGARSVSRGHTHNVPRSGAETRRKILDAAEQLFADKGLDATTFGEINKLSGQRNNSATQYHFGDKVALLEAITERHLAQIGARRAELVAKLPPDATIRDFVEALVRPVAMCLEDESGVRYLSIQASLLSHPDRDQLPDTLSKPWLRSSVVPVAEGISDRMTVDELPDSNIRRRLISNLLFHALADEARSTKTPEEMEWFVETLIDIIVSIVEAPIRADIPRAQ